MNIKQYIFVIRELTGREIKRKYARSFLGIFWSVLNPLLSMAVISMVFSTMFERNIDNFPIYYLTGSVLWHMFTGATNSAMNSLVDNKNMLIKVKLPKQIFPLSRIYTALVNLGYSMVAYMLMCVVFKVKPAVTMLCFPTIVILLLLFSIGIGYMLSIVYVFFADIKYLYSVVLTLWMYMSALFYPVERLSEGMQKVISLNPIYCFIAAARGCVMHGEWPSGWLWIKMLLWSLIVFALGIIVFESNQNKIMQRL